MSKLDGWYLKTLIPVVKDFFEDDNQDQELDSTVESITKILENDIGTLKL